MRFFIHPKPPVVNSLKSWRVANNKIFKTYYNAKKKKISNKTENCLTYQYLLEATYNIYFLLQPKNLSILVLVIIL